MLRPQDLDLLNNWEHERFWALICAYLEEKITNSKELIYNAGRNEEHSKLKWNDRDLHFVEIEILEDLKKARWYLDKSIEELERNEKQTS